MTDKTTVFDMTYSEFNKWAHEIVISRFLDDGMRGMRSGLDLIISQQALIFERNKGFQKK